MSDDAADFYDDLADDYDLIFEDWSASIAWQASVLVPLLHGLGVPPGGTVLDASCGIGTQAIGLAGGGFVVTGTDISPGAVERAARETAARGLDATFAVADLRTLDRDVVGEFDAALSFDNSLAHMHGAADLEAAIRGLAARTRPGGVTLASIRPYDALAAERPTVTHPRVSGRPGARRASFQLWTWADDTSGYVMEQLTLRESPDGWTTTARTTRLRAVRKADLLAAFATAGLESVEWLEPETSGFYQPIVLGRRPA